MQVQAIPTMDFQHGDMRAVCGRAQMVEEGLAHDLEAAGLLRIKSVVVGPYAGLVTPGKSGAAGEDPPSCASPAARVLSKPIAPAFARGVKGRRSGA